MNAVQEVYAIAKAQFETIKEAVRAETKPHKHLLNNEETFEKFFDIEEAAEDKHGYWEAKEVLREAENTLIEWGWGFTLKTDPAIAEKVSHVYEAARAYRQPVREKLIDATFRLAI
jgi:hypothetical protein